MKLRKRKSVELIEGTEFDTPFERGCIVVTLPDGLGTFIALDSDGVECEFTLDMVACVRGES